MVLLEVFVFKVVNNTVAVVLRMHKSTKNEALTMGYVPCKERRPPTYDG